MAVSRYFIILIVVTVSVIIVCSHTSMYHVVGLTKSMIYRFKEKVGVRVLFKIFLII
jgi:hypothetical protein